jgi:hypothetical protein
VSRDGSHFFVERERIETNPTPGAEGIRQGSTRRTFRIENIVPEKSLAYYMGPMHWLDALTPPLEEHLKRHSVSVHALVRAASSATDEQQREEEAKLRDVEMERLRRKKLRNTSPAGNRRLTLGDGGLNLSWLKRGELDGKRNGKEREKRHEKEKYGDGGYGYGGCIGLPIPVIGCY